MDGNPVVLGKDVIERLGETGYTPTCGLTRKQWRVYCTLAKYFSEFGYMPTIRELCERLLIKSPNGVICHIKALCKKGWLVHTETTARSLTLVGIRKELVVSQPGSDDYNPKLYLALRHAGLVDDAKVDECNTLEEVGV